VLLRAAQGPQRQDPAAALARLAELPTGAQRRTAALRLKLKATRQAGHIVDAMETARLLAKHRAFSPQAAASLLRGLAAEQIAGSYDAEQLPDLGRAGPARARHARAALRAAQRLIDLGGDAALARGWLLPVWDDMLAQPDFFTDAQRVRLAQVLEQALSEQGADAEWLARIESAQQAHPRDATLQYLAGMACLQRGLWAARSCCWPRPPARWTTPSCAATPGARRRGWPRSGATKAPRRRPGGRPRRLEGRTWPASVDFVIRRHKSNIVDLDYDVDMMIAHRPLVPVRAP
jgi:hypothetical protein